MSTWAVVMAGGRGTRFWPLSRAACPKQCLALDGERTLLEQTLVRLRHLVPPDRTLVVTGPDMADAVTEQAGLPEGHVLVEPSGRNTLPCLAWATGVVHRRGGSAVVALPADHWIDDAEALASVLGAAVEAAVDTGRLVLLGVSPTHPETGYGWVVPGPPLGQQTHHELSEVAAFVEKPPAPRARALIDSGALWNSGMFAWTPAAFEAALARWAPGAARLAVAARAGDPIANLWEDAEATSVDYGVLEREPMLAVVPCEVGWADLGAWPSVARLLPKGELGAARIAAGVCLDGGRHVVYAPDKLVATLGVSDLVIVDTPDALLICDLEKASRIPEVVEELRRRGMLRWT